MALLYTTLLRHTPKYPLICVVRSGPPIASCSIVQYEKFIRRPMATGAKKDLRSNTRFHETDKLYPERWQLIYYNDWDEQYAERELHWYLGGFLAILFTGAVFTALYFLIVLPRMLSVPNEMKPLGADRLELQYSVFAFVFLPTWLLATRYRRLRVSRIYELKPGKQLIRSHSKFPLARNTEAGNDLCIVWKSFYMYSKPFYYNRKQTRWACERDTIPGMFLGNFRVRMRPWVVYKEYFEDPNDYTRVRTAPK